MSGNSFKKKFFSLPFKKGEGFTLVEMLVVLAVFSVFTVVIVNVFLLSLRAQRQTSLRQETLADLRFVTETIARQIRTSEIDYAAYGVAGVSSPEDELFLIDQNGNNLRYSLFNAEIIFSIDDGVAPAQVASITNKDQVQVVNLYFYITPITNPFFQEQCNDALTPTGCQGVISCTVDDPDTTFKLGFCQCGGNPDCATGYCNEGICLPFDQQPRVTMILGFESSGVKLEEQKRIFLQTTVSSRVYKR